VQFLPFTLHTAVQNSLMSALREAAYILDTYLTRPSWSFHPPCPFLWNDEKDPSLDPMTVLELGSGTGYAGFAIAKTLMRSRGRSAAEAVDRVIVTDLPEVCPLLEENRRKDESLDGSPIILVRSLSWGNSEHAVALAQDLHSLRYGPNTSSHLTHIICSDLVYFPELLAPLLRSLITLTDPHDSTPFLHTEVLISYKVRSLSKEMPFWTAFGLWFEFEPVLFRSSLGDDWARFGAHMDDLFFVFVARRKEESYHWEVPEDNSDLLAGVGALGTPLRKGDATFETLLLMNMDTS
jgi:protein N-lysine methyltransferase METTL21D